MADFGEVIETRYVLSKEQLEASKLALVPCITVVVPLCIPLEMLLIFLMYQERLLQ